MQKYFFPIFVAILALSLLVAGAWTVVLNNQASSDINTVIAKLIEAANQANAAPTDRERAEIKRQFMELLWPTGSAMYGDGQSNYINRAGGVFDSLATCKTELLGVSIIRNRERVAALVELTLKRPAEDEPTATPEEVKKQLILVNTRDRMDVHRWVPITLLDGEEGCRTAVLQYMFPAAGVRVKPTIPGPVAKALGAFKAPTHTPESAVTALLPSAVQGKLKFDWLNRAQWVEPMTKADRNALIAAWPDGLGGSLEWTKFVWHLYLNSMWEGLAPSKDKAKRQGDVASLTKVFEEIVSADTDPVKDTYLDEVVRRLTALKKRVLEPASDILLRLEPQVMEWEDAWRAATERGDAVAAAELDKRIGTVLGEFKAITDGVMAAMAAEGIAVKPAPGADTTPPQQMLPDRFLRVATVAGEPLSFDKGVYRDYTSCVIRIRFEVERKKMFDPPVIYRAKQPAAILEAAFAAINTAVITTGRQRETVRSMYKRDIIKGGNINAYVRSQRVRATNAAYSEEANNLRNEPNVSLQDAMQGLAQRLADAGNDGDVKALAEWLDVATPIQLTDRQAEAQKMFDAVEEILAHETTRYNTLLVEQFKDRKSEVEVLMEPTADWDDLTDQQRTDKRNEFKRTIAEQFRAIIKANPNVTVGLDVDTRMEKDPAKLTWQGGEMHASQMRNLLALSKDPRWRMAVINLCKATENNKPTFYDWFGFAGYMGKTLEVTVIAAPVMTPDGPAFEWRPVKLEAANSVYNRSISGPWKDKVLAERDTLVKNALVARKVAAAWDQVQTALNRIAKHGEFADFAKFPASVENPTLATELSALNGAKGAFQAFLGAFDHAYCRDAKKKASVLNAGDGAFWRAVLDVAEAGSGDHAQRGLAELDAALEQMTAQTIANAAELDLRQAIAKLKRTTAALRIGTMTALAKQAEQRLKAIPDAAQLDAAKAMRAELAAQITAFNTTVIANFNPPTVAQATFEELKAAVMAYTNNLKSQSARVYRADPKIAAFIDNLGLIEAALPQAPSLELLKELAAIVEAVRDPAGFVESIKTDHLGWLNRVKNLAAGGTSLSANAEVKAYSETNRRLTILKLLLYGEDGLLAAAKSTPDDASQRPEWATAAITADAQMVVLERRLHEAVGKVDAITTINAEIKRTTDLLTAKLLEPANLKEKGQALAKAAGEALATADKLLADSANKPWHAPLTNRLASLVAERQALAALMAAPEETAADEYLKYLNGLQARSSAAPKTP